MGGGGRKRWQGGRKVLAVILPPPRLFYPPVTCNLFYPRSRKLTHTGRARLQPCGESTDRSRQHKMLARALFVLEKAESA